MKRRHIAFILTALVLLTVFYLANHRPSAPEKESATIQKVVANQPATITTIDSELASQTNAQTASTDQPSHAAPANERVAWWREMTKKDPYFEFKTPLLFYGKVVDDQGFPVKGANIKFSWMDLSSEGTGKKYVMSDVTGLFSLSGVVGKDIGVHISKEGYRCYISSNRFDFETSILSGQNYYNPIPENPVVFVLRKNREAEPIIEYSEKRAEVPQGQSKQFTIGPNGTTLLFERMTNNAPVRGGWVARVSVPGGGLALTTEEFPYEAPEDGYVDSMEITNATPKPPNWPSFYGAMMYFKTSQGYGRVMVSYISNMDRMFVTSWFNPKAGSRNLEVDPSKVQVIKP
jgi:hypothetical protein